MTPEEKAKELVDKYIKVIKERTDVFNAYSDLSFAKELALTCVDEIFKVNQDAWSRIPDIGEFEDYIPYIYWQQVKKEINKI